LEDDDEEHPKRADEDDDDEEGTEEELIVALILSSIGSLTVLSITILFTLRLVCNKVDIMTKSFWDG
jgi:hypothetical protein